MNTKLHVNSMGIAAKKEPAMSDGESDHTKGGKSHRWAMVACCIPMLAIALVLALAGVISWGFMFFAVACTAMMAMMMGGMDHGSGGHK